MMKKLFRSISEERWEEVQKDPVKRELVQTALFRINDHLSTAIRYKEDFRQFHQNIDLVHSELTTILALFSPFKVPSFEQKFRKYLEPLFPEGMSPTTVGVARSAMNVFAGINAAIIEDNSNPVRICGDHSYYEEVGLVGGNRTLKQALGDPAIDKIDMYVAEFYHNIDIDLNHTRYQKGRVIKDIRDIFDKKPKTDKLTVAIDATIDFAKSDDIKELLNAFKDEISSGKLNIVIFRSGQKFDMLGLDNYFGSPFYLVNNGEPKWEKFNKIKTSKVFQTDPLSQQFFSWMYETGPNLIDKYKGQIFSNTRSILNTVPPGLTPEVSPTFAYAVRIKE